MPINDDLTPSDGLSNRWIELDGLDFRDDGHTDVRFRIYDNERDGSKRYVTTLSFAVHGSDELYEIVARGHDHLIRFLRQGLHLSNILRTVYRKEAEKVVNQTQLPSDS